MIINSTVLHTWFPTRKPVGDTIQSPWMRQWWAKHIRFQDLQQWKLWV